MLEGTVTILAPDDVADIDVDIETVVILAEFFAQRHEPGRRAVFEHLTIYLLKGFETFGRSRDVGLTDVEMVDPDAVCLGRVQRLGA